MTPLVKKPALSGAAMDAADGLMADEFGHRFLRLLGYAAFNAWYLNQEFPSKDEADELCFGRSHLWIDTSDICQSLIEKILYAHLLFITDGYQLISGDDYPYGDTHLVATIEPQGSIGDYRADFLIKVRVRHLTSIIVVECDGHDWHERTKHQAARDKSRDRFMTQAGAKILRFTGSEIVRDAAKCAEEVELLVQSVRYELEKQVPGWDKP